MGAIKILLWGSAIITEASITIVLPEPTSPTTMRFAAFFSLAKSSFISAITVCCSLVNINGKLFTKGLQSPFKVLNGGKSALLPRSFFKWLYASINFSTPTNSGLNLPSSYTSSILLGKCICISVATSFESKPS